MFTSKQKAAAGTCSHRRYSSRMPSRMCHLWSKTKVHFAVVILVNVITILLVTIILLNQPAKITTLFQVSILGLDIPNPKESALDNFDSVNTTLKEQKQDYSSSVDEPKCPGIILYNKFCVFYNIVKADEAVNRNETVTLSTQGTPEFLYHVKELCVRWGGPLSVAIYAPGSTYLVARSNIEILKNCNVCIRRWVTWNIFFDNDHIPPPDDLDFHQTVYNSNCTLSILDNKKTVSYLEKHRLTYPINVARNIAKFVAQTHFVFPSDIELYPSNNIIPRFLEMIRRSPRNASSESRRQVWVLPVFEVESDVTVPTEKEQLRSLYNQAKALSFHKYRCDTCHRIHNLDRWLRSSGDSHQLHVFSTVKRQKSFKLQAWEPFFIGTEKEPEFDPRLTWEGKQNKMQVAYEMCQLSYDFNILDDAFLVHSPGINKYHKNSPVEMKRRKHLRKNAKILKKIEEALRVKYQNPAC